MYFLEIFIFIIQHILDSVRRDKLIDFFFFVNLIII